MADDESLESSSRPASPVGPLNNIPSTSRQHAYRFAWDSPHRRPGPPSVADTNDSRADFFNQAPKGSLFLGSSISLGGLGATPPEWSSSKHGLNAISTVLNNPYKRGAPPKAHSSLPVLPPADLPRVKRKDFDGYLRSIGPEWEKFERNLQLGREGTAQIDSATGAESSQLARAAKQAPPLSTIPQVYFEESFDLTNPATFAAVTEVAGTNNPLDPGDPAYSGPLLEKMSHYTDTLELHLIREISLRSTSFFAALSNLQDLQTESERCLNRISHLREILKEVDEKGARRGLEVVRLEKRKENLHSVAEGVKVVSGVGEMMNVARGFVGAGDWTEALSVIEGIEGIWEPKPPPTPAKADDKSLPILPNGNGRLAPIPETPTSTSPSHPILPITIPLSSIQAFSSLPSQLQELTFQITESLTRELLLVFKTNLEERIAAPRKAVSPGSKVEDSLPLSLDNTRQLRASSTRLIHGLVRTNGIKDVIVKWRNSIMDVIKSSVKKHLPSSDFDEDESGTTRKSVSERSASLASFLREKSHQDFTVTQNAIYDTLLNCLEGINAQGKVLIEILEEISLPKDLELPSLKSDLSDTLGAAAELANTRASKVLAIRSEQHAALDLTSFVNLFDSTWQFVVACEVICQKMIVGLRGTIVNQARSFLSEFHKERLSRSAKLVEDEQWAVVEVSSVAQHSSDQLVDAAVRDPPEFSLNKPVQTPATNGITKKNGASSSKQLHIEDRTFHVVAATLDVLGLLGDYLRVIINLPLLTTDAMSRVVEFLKAFNSRTCQVVLGAGAMRSAGLKNITAKHLALASQSLSVMIALIPYVRETFRRHLNPKQAVMLIEFDKLKRDYQEHQNEIHSKLVGIMSDRLQVHCKSLPEIDWSLRLSAAPKVNPYMEGLIKDTTTLHKVLFKFLPGPSAEFVMSQVFATINHQLSEEYGKIELPSIDAKERLLSDVRYLRDKLSTLKGVGNSTGMLEIVVTEKRIPGPVSPAPPAKVPSPPPISVTTSQEKTTNVPNPPARTNSVPTPTQSTVRKNPFAGNARISSLLSSVTSVAKSEKPLPSSVTSAATPNLDIKSSSGFFEDKRGIADDSKTSGLLRETEGLGELGSTSSLNVGSVSDSTSAVDVNEVVEQGSKGDDQKGENREGDSGGMEKKSKDDRIVGPNPNPDGESMPHSNGPQLSVSKAEEGGDSQEMSKDGDGAGLDVEEQKAGDGAKSEEDGVEEARSVENE
ncbi:Vps54-domain-containing protein [Sistotremastrum suecicum HHB10207 ss-3]|uniref:Vps54-domain-containing protein n=1 Tax=Sistotremastrum suecicum HHB10207 ss-3 TaxID=1314776 RepID=A0A166ELA9_9AGAM|nr:Vps54-domain-containing protein [Sistotremastrum suecicum HHB10207 ss-3]